MTRAAGDGGRVESAQPGLLRDPHPPHGERFFSVNGKFRRAAALGPCDSAKSAVGNPACASETGNENSAVSHLPARGQPALGATGIRVEVERINNFPGVGEGSGDLTRREEVLCGNKAIARRLGLNRSQTNRLLMDGAIPRWFNHSGLSCAHASDVDRWLAKAAGEPWAAIAAWENEGGSCQPAHVKTTRDS